MLTGHCRSDYIARADAGHSGPNQARRMSAARAERMGQTSRQAARAQVRKSWPLRSLERLRGALAQTGLRAVALPLRARSHSDSPCSPNTQSGATVGGVRAVALAPNSGANYLLKFTSTRDGGKEAEIQFGGARSPPTPALACAQRPCPRAGPITRACAAPRPRFTLAAPSPPLPCAPHAAPHLPSTPPALRVRSLGPRARWPRVRRLSQR